MLELVGPNKPQSCLTLEPASEEKLSQWKGREVNPKRTLLDGMRDDLEWRETLIPKRERSGERWKETRIPIEER